MKRIAIYSRKSKFTGHGDSTENQIQLCKEYARMHFNSTDEDITIFEDEGFSGGTTNRPQFKLLTQNIKQKKFDVLICYRLDRISRNIADFSATIEDLEHYNVSFVSIKEQFDTSTPMGRAMMYIASVFAQLERETIAERIKDNLQQLAKTGRWLGGVAPTGYESKEVTIVDEEGKKRTEFKLEIIEDEANQIKLLFKKFLEFKSLSKLSAYCIKNEIKSKRGNYYTRQILGRILENPVYCIADKTVCNHLKELGHNIYVSEEEFKGKNGLMAYNKTDQSGKNERFKNTGWSISVGQHTGIIKSTDWIMAHNLRFSAKGTSHKKRHKANAMLSGILICGECGSFMRKCSTRTNKDGTVTFYYTCELKERSKKHKCNSRNIRGDKLDKMVINELKKLSGSTNLNEKITKDRISISNARINIEEEMKRIKNEISKNDISISNLVKVLSEQSESFATKHILDQINNTEKQNITLKERLLELNDSFRIQGIKDDENMLVSDILTNFNNVIDSASDKDKKMLIRTLVDKIIWDGKNIDVALFGANM